MGKTGKPNGRAGPALAGFFHHRWALPVMAELHRSRGAKFVTLVNRLGVGRDTLSRTLKALADQGLAQRNPGYGHPMRPEYILTADGASIGMSCEALMAALDGAGLAKLGLKKWSMPVVHALAASERRFSELQAELGDATPRALTSILKQLAERDLVERTLHDGYPPTTLYSLAEVPAAPLIEPLAALAAGLVSGGAAVE